MIPAHVQVDPPLNQPPLREAVALLDGHDKSLDEGRRLAAICAGLRSGTDIMAAALLHPALRDGQLPADAVQPACGDDVHGLLATLSDLGRLEEAARPGGDDLPGSSENLRKLLLTLASDVRVVLLRLVLQLDAMRHIDDLDPDAREVLARATREIWAPLASRLGIWQLKWELEDLAFRMLEPGEYRRVANWLKASRGEREQLLAAAIERLDKALQEAGITPLEIVGRPKHLYSIWRKMQRKQLEFTQLRDIQAIRVVVENVSECYAALGIVHGTWQHIPGAFDDYITHPKENDYRSLHTAVIGPGGRPLEAQIRSREMHEAAELGVASHWRYKESVRFDASFEQRLAWLRRLLEPGEADDENLLERLRSELLEERVYALTPQGRIIDLPAGATVLDFAYHVHTELGHRCRGARINGKIAPLTTTVNTGDQVEIIAAREGGPSRDWLTPQLGYLVSSRGRDKVRAWFRRQHRERNVASGRQMLERELARLNLRDVNLVRLARHLEFKRVDDLYAAIGAADITLGQVAGALQRLHSSQDARHGYGRSAVRRRVDTDPGGAVRIEGVGGMMTNFARCCRPVPEEAIAGYVTRGRGVTVHRVDCHNMMRLRDVSPERVLDVAWGGDAHRQSFPVNLEVVAWNRRTLLQDITSVLSGNLIAVRSVHMDTDSERNAARVELTVDVSDLEQLSTILNRIARLPNVINARRI